MKKVRLTGKALTRLNDQIHDRDNHQCIYCGRYVREQEKFHHEPCGSGNKEDKIEKGCLLCMDCHAERHGGLDSHAVRQACEDYLKQLYPVV